MRLNFGRVLARTNGERIGTDLCERDRRSVLSMCAYKRQAETQHRRTGKQRESTETTSRSSIHRNFVLRYGEWLTQSCFPEWQDIRGQQRCTVVATVPLKISRNLRPCQCERSCNFGARSIRAGLTAGVLKGYSLACPSLYEHDRHIVPVDRLPTGGFQQNAR